MTDPFLVAERVIKGEPLTLAEGVSILTGDNGGLLDLVSAAYRVRRHYFGNEVTLHILNNVQNGLCSEDCSYCAQSTAASAKIDSYPMKPDAEILAEAQAAFESGAARYCMVFSGAGPSAERLERLCSLIREIKSRYKIEVCVSPGIISAEQAQKLKSAGLDRLNHNLNTSAQNYQKICTTHSFTDRLATLEAAKSVGLAVCSGLIAGMGESAEDLVALALTFRGLAVESIPVNFLIPVSGVAIPAAVVLTPEFCLRILCLFRLTNPQAEIRMAAGREFHLRSLEPLGLYAANSLFLNGYLNVSGHSDTRTLRMIQDAGFCIRSEISLQQLLAAENPGIKKIRIKDIDQLRPFKN